MRNPFAGKLPPLIGLEAITQEGFIDRTKHTDIYSTLPAYLGKYAEESGYRPRMPGYSLPTSTLFKALTLREPFPVTRLLLQLRIRGE